MSKPISQLVSAARVRAATAVLAAVLAAQNVPAAETYEEWLRSQQEAARQSMASEAEFRAVQDREFAQFLAAQWREFRVFEALSRDTGPKPREAPVAPPPGQAPRPAAAVTPPAPPGPAVKRPEPEPAQTPQPARVTPTPPVPGPAPSPPVAVVPPPAPRPGTPEPTVKRTEPTPAQTPKPARVAPTAPLPPTPAPTPPAPSPPAEALAGTPVVFFGREVRVPLDPRWRQATARGRDARDVARFWSAMAGTAVQPAVSAVDAACRDLPLDDWGRVLLWQEIARLLRPDSADDQLLLTWFFLLQSGVDARIGLTDGSLLLLIAVRQPVFGELFVTVNGQRYYALAKSGRSQRNASITMPDGQYAGRLRPLDIPSASTAFVGASSESRTLRFDAAGRRHTLSVSFDRQVVSYLAQFPQMDFDPYFASPPGRLASRTLAEVLREQVRPMDEEQAVNFLLALVQKSFEYKTDADQFGQEKYFFAEEVLFYPYSDCEDRSVLFAWLVRELLGLDVVGLHYPGHVTTAVAMTRVRPEWHTVESGGRRYVLADPTYINASVGMAMPSYAGTRPLRTIPGFQAARTGVPQ